MPKIVNKSFNVSHKVCDDAMELADEMMYDLDYEQRKKIYNFKRLEPHEQTIFMLHSQGYSLREIASYLGDVSFFWVWDKLRIIKDKINNV